MTTATATARADDSTPSEPVPRISLRALATLALLSIPLPFLVAANNGDYLWTDTLEIGGGAIIRKSFRSLVDAFRGGIEGHYYRPTVFALHALDFALFGDHPIAFRLTNLCLHEINVFLLYVLIKRVFKDAHSALATATLFAIHPLVATPLAWVSDRTDLAALTATLGFFLLVDAYVVGGGGRRAKADLVAAAVCLLLGLGAKETVASSLLVTGVVWTGSQGVPRHRLRRVIIMQGIVVGAWFLWRNHVGTNSVQHMGDIPARDRVALASYIHLEYLWQLLVPYRLTVCDGMRIPQHPAWWIGVGLVIIGGSVSGAAVRWARRPRQPGAPGAGLVTAWTVALLVPTSGIVALKHVRADRYLYCALPGVILLSVQAIRRWSSRRAGRPVLSMVIFAACYVYFSASLLLRSRRFATDADLWGYETGRNAECLEGESYLAHAALLANRLSEAMALCNLALASSPGVVAYVDSDATIYLKGLILAEGGDEEGATVILLELLKNSGNRAIRAESAYELGLIAIDGHAYQTAIDDFDLSQEIAPSAQNQSDLFLARSYAHLHLGNIDACRRDLVRFDALASPGKPNPLVEQLLSEIRPALAR